MTETEPIGAGIPSPLDTFADPRSLLAILWDGRRLIVGCLLTCVLIASAYLLFATRLYQASAKLLVIEQANSPMSSAGGASRSLVNAIEDAIPTHLAILNSPIVVRRAVESVGLNNLPSLGSSPLTVENATIELVQSIEVSRPDRLAKIIEVSYRARSGAEALRLVQAITASYQKFLDEVYAQSNGEVVVLMTKARNDLDRELKELGSRYLELRRKSPSLLGDESGRTFYGERLEEWNKTAREAMVKAVQLKAQLELGQELASQGVGLWSIAHAMDQIASSSKDSLSGRLQADPSGTPVDYLRQLAAEQQRLSDTLGPQSTKVKEIQEQIARAQASSRSTRNQIERAEIDELLTSVGKSLSSLEEMRRDIQAKLEVDLKLAKEAEADQIAEANLKSEIERQRKLFDTVVDQLKQATLVGDYAGTRAVVVEPPTALPRPVLPKKSLTLILALCAGLALGLTTALGAELIAPRVRSVDDLRRMLRLPILGELPFVPEASRPAMGSMGLICEMLPRSPSAEAYRVVRANLELVRRGREARVVLVTAPDSGDGNSTVASNLAVALAQAGRVVALVDANLRSPSQHKIFGLTRDRGLTHLIRDLLPRARVAQATRVPKLDLIAAGPEVSNPAELLSSSELSEVLLDLRSRYDIIVVDTPPLLAYADASLLGAVADSVILVVRASATRRADASRALEVLKGLGTSVAGVVINGGDPERSPGWNRLSWPGNAPRESPAIEEPPGRRPSPSDAEATPPILGLDPRMTLGSTPTLGEGIAHDPRLTRSQAVPWLNADPALQSPRHHPGSRAGGPS